VNKRNEFRYALRAQVQAHNVVVGIHPSGLLDAVGDTLRVVSGGSRNIHKNEAHSIFPFKGGWGY